MSDGAGHGLMTPLRVIVVGGGIAGLAAAHRLVELARDEGQPLDWSSSRLPTGWAGRSARSERTGSCSRPARTRSSPRSRGHLPSWSALDSGRASAGRTTASAAPTSCARDGCTGGVPAPRPHARVAGAGFRRFLLAGKASTRTRPGSAAPPRRPRREPRELRAAPARTRGARARGPAARWRDLHGGY